MKKIGGLLTGEHNATYSIPDFFAEPNNVKCPACLNLYSPFYFDQNLSLKTTSLDFSSTYEGAIIVSERFKDFCLENGFQNLLFVPITSADHFYHFQVLGNVAKVDLPKSNINVGELCKVCGFPSEIIGGVDLFINAEWIKGFCITDIYWRTHNVFKARFLVDLDTMKALKDARFKGLNFKPVYST